MVLSNAQGALVSPDLMQNLQAVDQAVAVGGQALQGAVNLIVRHDQARDWRGIRAAMQQEAATAGQRQGKARG